MIPSPTLETNPLLTLTKELHSFLQINKIVMLRCEPEIVDFTQPWAGQLVIYGKQDSSMSFRLGDPKNLVRMAFLLQAYLFAKDRTIVTWDVKRLFSYFRYNIPKTVRHYLPYANIIDLKYSEGFYGVRLPPPASLEDALKRAVTFINDPKWRLISKTVFLPLALQVLPTIETKGLLDHNKKQSVFTSYEIEGQSNGRLNCGNNFSRCVNPHALTMEIRASLAPRGVEKQVFIELDYRHLEVSILQWITGDEVLGELAKNGDVYLGIYQKIFDKECIDEQRRKQTKLLFLSVLFGRQAFALSQNMKISVPAAETIIQKIWDGFPVAMNWLQEKQDELATNPLATDYFGRRRLFNEKHYLRRNFEIQSPAAFVCMEKLVRLHKYLSQYIVFYIYDSYVLVAPLDKAERIAKLAKRILESPSQLCEGLVLKVKCKVGEKLSNMREVKL